MAGGALGGLATGAVVKLIGLDAFDLLFGQAPEGMTGAAEGLALGAAVGLGVWAATRIGRIRQGAPAAAAIAGLGGVAIVAAGGRMMAGSLELLAVFPRSNLSLAPLGALAGETGFGPIAQAVTAGLEAALFGGCIAAALMLERRRKLG